MTHLACAALVLVACTGISVATSAPVFGTFFPDWAQYRPKPYTFQASDLSGVASISDHMVFSFAFFCPDPAVEKHMPYWVTERHLCDGKKPYSIVLPDPKDEQFIEAMTAMKGSNPNLKIVASVGGWNFPSRFFSSMVASPASRAAFVASAQQLMEAHSLDGLSLDWEFPGSPPRNNPVKMTCSQFETVVDDGGAATDKAGFTALVQELRAAFGADKVISVASQAGSNMAGTDIKGMADSISYFHVMTYDYSVADTPSSTNTAPNSPLYNPDPATGAPAMSVDTTVKAYLAAGVPKSKIMVGIALYGHTWFVPNAAGTSWQTFGLKGSLQAACCGPFGQTYGAKYGKGAQLCGTLMTSEIAAAGFESYWDNTTQSTIGYLTKDSADGWDKAGTWVSHLGEQGIRAAAQYVFDNGLAGAYTFDASMDTVDFSSGTPTFKMSKLIASVLSGSTEGHE